MNKGATVVYYPLGEASSILTIGDKYVIEEFSHTINYKKTGTWVGGTFFTVYVNGEDGRLMVTLDSTDFITIEQYRIQQIENIINDA